MVPAAVGRDRPGLLFIPPSPTIRSAAAGASTIMDGEPIALAFSFLPEWQMFTSSNKKNLSVQNKWGTISLN
jgi:hypothetical protein